MKKTIILLFAILSFATFSVAQITMTDGEGNEILDGDVITFNIAGKEIGDEIAELYADVTNSSGATITCYVVCTEMVNTDGNLMDFCIPGGCVPNMVVDSPYGPFDIEAGASTGHDMHFHNKDDSGVLYYVLKVYEEGNEDNSITFTYKYDPDYVNISTLSEQNNLIAYPNPATTIVNFKYNVENTENTHIDLYNIIGKKIQVINIDNDKGIYPMRTNNLDAGIYFYNFVVNGKTVSSKKLIISD